MRSNHLSNHYRQRLPQNLNTGLTAPKAETVEGIFDRSSSVLQW